MGWNVQGEPIQTSNADAIVFQRVTLNKIVTLIAARAWFIFYGAPVFTSIKMGIFSMRNGQPQKLLWESDSRLAAECIDEANGVRELFFRFDELHLNDVTEYAFAPILDGYTYAEGSHIAWKSSYPDPVYRTGLTLDGNQSLVYPFDLYFVGADE